MLLNSKAKRVVRDYEAEFGRLCRITEGVERTKARMTDFHEKAWRYAMHKHRLPTTGWQTDAAMANFRQVLLRQGIAWDSLPD